MAHPTHDAGYRASATERRTLRGAMVFLALVALALLAVAYPSLAAAIALGALGGHLLGSKTDGRRA